MRMEKKQIQRHIRAFAVAVLLAAFLLLPLYRIASFALIVVATMASILDSYWRWVDEQ